MIFYRMAALAIFLGAPVLASPLDDGDRAEIVTNSARLLEERYVDAELGAELAEKLVAQSDAWDALDDPEGFAKAMTDWLRAASGDGHLGLTFSAEAISADAADDTFSAAEMERWYGAHLNHGVEKVERLDGNIMLLDLRVFAPADMAGDVIAAAMSLVAQGDALIIDLRNNGGGDGGTAALIAGYLLDESAMPLTGAYNRPRDEHRASTSPAWVPGRKFGGSKPLYILTSRRTFSAAEALAYDLQALNRAVIVGEVTGGGAHPFEYRRVHAHFALDLPEGRSVNPITGSNWQGVGVQPDVSIAAEQALGRAAEMARAAIAK